MKAYVIFPEPDPRSAGCVLIWAETRGKAKSRATGLVFIEDFIELRARRVPEMDPYCPEEKHFAMTNTSLPEGAPSFYREEE